MNELFYNITGKNREKLLDYLEVNSVKYKKNDIVLSNLLNDNLICVIVAGSLIITKTDENGNRIVIEELDEGSLFGTTFSHINNSDYQIHTKEDTNLLIFDYNYIISFDENRLSYYTQFLKNLTKILFDKIASNNERIELLSNKSIRNKILSYFKLLSKKSGTKTIYLPFSYTDLADYLVVNRSALSRELANMKDEGLIETKGKRVKLLYYIDNY